MVRWPSGKASVCKTDIRGFDSRPHLIFLKQKPPLGGFCFEKIGRGSNTNGLVLRRESKGVAMYEFCHQAKASTASPACRKTPSGVLPEGDIRPRRF